MMELARMYWWGSVFLLGFVLLVLSDWLEEKGEKSLKNYWFSSDFFGRIGICFLVTSFMALMVFEVKNDFAIQVILSANRYLWLLLSLCCFSLWLLLPNRLRNRQVLLMIILAKIGVLFFAFFFYSSFFP